MTLTKKMSMVRRAVIRRRGVAPTVRLSRQQYLHYLMQNTSDVISVVKVDGTVSYVNSSIQKVLGYRPEAWVGANMFDFVHPNDVRRVVDMFAAISNKPGLHPPVKFRLARMDGSWCHLEHVTATQPANSIMGEIILSSRDIMERKRFEEALRESEAKRQRLVDQLLTIQVDEQRRVALELHDGLAQLVNIAYQHLQAFAEQYCTCDTWERAKLDQALELVRLTTEEARRLIAELRPPPLTDDGLASAICDMVEALHAEGWEITFEGPCQEERLPEAVETALYGVAREALNNVRKHADSERVHIQLRLLGRSVCLRVQDWGRGFRPFEASHDTHLGERVGLWSMRERMHLVKGNLEISSQPGMGTTVVAEVPLTTRLEGATSYIDKWASV
jgi:PAS domain S-box-containing protein